MPNEILTEIEIPSARGVKNATYEVRQKEALDWPLATASVALKMHGQTVSKARVVLGHVAPTPWVAAEAEQALAGKSLSRRKSSLKPPKPPSKARSRSATTATRCS